MLGNSWILPRQHLEISLKWTVLNGCSEGLPGLHSTSLSSVLSDGPPNPRDPSLSTRHCEQSVPPLERKVHPLPVILLRSFSPNSQNSLDPLGSLPRSPSFSAGDLVQFLIVPAFATRILFGPSLSSRMSPWNSSTRPRSEFLLGKGDSSDVVPSISFQLKGRRLGFSLVRGTAQSPIFGTEGLT